MIKFLKSLFSKPRTLTVDINSQGYKEIMAAAKDATPENGISTKGMSDEEFLSLVAGIQQLRRPLDK